MEAITLTKKQEDIMLGSILGDGCINLTKTAGKYHYYLQQSDKNQDYIFWFYKELEPIFISPTKQRKNNKQWYLHSHYLETFAFLRNKFYPNGNKIIPKDIGSLLLSPLSLAVWFMDDGTLDYRPNDHCSFSIATHSFSLGDVKCLTDTLKKNFSLDVKVYNNFIRGKRYPRIYIGKEGRERFIELISPFILPCFYYKLPQYRQPLRDFSRIKLEGWQGK